jgi:2-oxoglutarate ferredoxin oxidoreductase subunit beta
MVHLKATVKAAILHKGFSLVDIFQPCVSFNKVNTYEWYKQRVYDVGADYNPEDRTGAFQKALEWGDRIPLGVIYKNNRPTFDERVPLIKELPLVNQEQSVDRSKIEAVLMEFY